MLLVLVVILLLIGAAVVGSIYSNFLVFYSSFNESENYHKAYYNSISALERAELVTKQRAPGFEGSGGFTGGVNASDQSPSDKIMNDNSFSYISDPTTKYKNSIYRTINSKTNRIPSEGQGDVESMLAYNDDTNLENPENSNNYNMMDYTDSQVFLLYWDNGEGNPYNKTSCQGGGCTDANLGSISGIIRLPLYMRTSFGELDQGNPLTSNGPDNDPIVDRQIKGKYKTNPSDSSSYPFTVYATQSFYDKDIFEDEDSAIRESDINGDAESQQLNFDFFQPDKKRSPTKRGKNALLTIISPKENEIKGNNPNNFGYIFNNDNDKFTEKQLRFSLLNLLKTENEMIYPFLEYFVDFGGVDVSDKYFTINAEGNYDDYKINLIVWKPTLKESILGSFTTIF